MEPSQSSEKPKHSFAIGQKSEQTPLWKQKVRIVSAWTALFSILLLFIALISSALISGDRVIYKDISKQERLDPFVVEEDNQLVAIIIEQRFGNSMVNKWRTFTIDILDSTEQYLCTVGSETFFESGRDDEGWWTEEKNKATLEITLHKGIYHFNVSTKEPITMSSFESYFPWSQITIERRMVGSFPLYLFGFVGVCLAVIGSMVASDPAKDKDSDDSE
jgi:phosphotransferase system  glucose/maltose/N-acetylglucosamine-specific IIC component